jgi:hypothetical protein
VTEPQKALKTHEEARLLLRRLWDKAVISSTYVDAEWLQMQSLVDKLYAMGFEVALPPPSFRFVDFCSRGSLVWQEDECLRHDPEAERLPGAWRRLFSSDIISETVLVSAWRGDSRYDLYSGERVAALHPEGHAIYHFKLKAGRS